MTEKILQKKPYPMGAHPEGGGVRFSFVSGSASCGVLLYDKTTGKQRRKINFDDADRIGRVYCRTVFDIAPESSTYLFFENDRLVPDERARVFPKRIAFGKKRSLEDLRAGFLTEAFDWEDDCFPRLPYNRMLVYCMHVRGFTKHASSNVRHRGTFAGIGEKIAYLKEIGVTTIELQPAYEFTEIAVDGECRHTSAAMPVMQELAEEEKINYWGYKRGYYYMPKGAYASSGDPGTEFKTLVRSLHAEGMELIMQFYFPNEVKRSEISEILRFWVLEYHVDGFHLLGENIPADLLAADDVLADSKLWYYCFDTAAIYGRTGESPYPHTAEYNDCWCYDMRRFLKGDGGMLGSVLYHMRHIPDRQGRIHYLSNYSGFTLADLVSYDYKHNEANGEENRDGTDYNCSWNCGEEGSTRRQAVRQLRIKQMKNAICLLLLSQSTPLIFMGDEFGNSQKGNNNPYCQDNAVTWLDWGGIKKNREIWEFWKKLVDFRKNHPILRPAKELRLMDYIACGYPDLSYHGHNAWCPQTENIYRHIGIMFCGKYARTGESCDDTFIYLAMNMHWDSRRLALPRLPAGMRWEEAFATESADAVRKTTSAEECGEFRRNIPPRSITVYLSVSA